MKNQKILFLIISLSLSAIGISQVRYYASNRVQNAVNSYQEDGTFIEEFITMNEGGLSNPQDILLHPEGFLLITGSDNPQIKKFDRETGEFLGDWSDQGFDLGRPSKMTIGPDNLLYVTQWGQTASTAKIVRFDLNGNYLGPFTPLAPTGMGHVWDDEGNFYLAIFGTSLNIGEIRKYDSNGSFIEVFIDSAVLENPTYIWWDANGDMLVEDFTAGKVLRYDNNGNFIEEFITGLTSPEGYTVLPNGNLLIAERDSNQISAWDSDGNFLERWDTGGILEGVNFIEPIDPSTLNLSENLAEETFFVSPSIGSQFKLNRTLLNYLSEVEVYTMTGTLIEAFKFQEKSIWNAENLSDGMYLLVAKDIKGSRHTQKIIVQKK